MLYTSYVYANIKIDKTEEVDGLKKLDVTISRLPAVTHVDYSV